jgi:hypothetical protein
MECNCIPDEYGHLLDCALLWDEMGYLLTYNDDGTVKGTRKPNERGRE